MSVKTYPLTAIAAAVAFAFSTGAMAAQAISKEDYKAGQDKIAADYKSAKSACDALKANAKDVCMAEAKGRQKVGSAELEARKSPSDKSRHAVAVAKAESEYAVAKEKCDDKAGEAKTRCVKEANDVQAKAKAEANAQQKSDSSGTPAKKTAAAAPSKSQSPGAYVDDSVITGKVKMAILEDPALKSAEINVETHKGVVQLSGFVISAASIDKAVTVAKGVAGVKSVKNDMIVKGKQ